MRAMFDTPADWTAFIATKVVAMTPMDHSTGNTRPSNRHSKRKNIENPTVSFSSL